MTTSSLYTIVVFYVLRQVLMWGNDLQKVKRHKVTTELPFVGVDDVSIVQDSAGEVHVFAHPEEEVVIHQENPKTGEVGQDGHFDQLSV